MNELSNTVALHEFGNGSGTTLEDDSGSGNDATINGGTWSTAPRKFDGALSFDGTDGSNAEYATNPFGTTTGVLGMEAWVYPRSSGGRQDIFGFYQMFDLTWDDLTEQGFTFRLWGDNDGGNLDSGGYAVDSWHHINLYWDIGTEVGLSVNGGAWQTYASGNLVDNDNGPFYIAEHGGGSNNFDGKVAGVRLTAGSKIPIADSLYYTAGSVGNMTDSAVQRTIDNGVLNLK